MKGKSVQKKTEKAFSQVAPHVEIILDSESFKPFSDNGEFYLKANVPVSVAGVRLFCLVHRNSCSVDCGFDVVVPEGYRLVLDLVEEFKDHGLEIYKNSITGKARMTVGLRNLGREIAVVSHMDKIAKVRIEPLYSLSFKVVGA